MVELTKAQWQVLGAFQQGPEDPFEIDSLTVQGISMRAGIDLFRLRRTLDCLERDGMLSSGFTATEYRFRITDAGRAALPSEPTP
jgi:DNA-binding MarR family transcriptional regulator